MAEVVTTENLAETPVDAFACTLNGLTATALDGRTASLDRCSWVMIAPCTCMAGIIHAVSGDRVRLTPNQALLALSENAADARESAAAGFRMILTLQEDYQSGLLALFEDCKHAPQWGVQRQEQTVDGITFVRLSATRWAVENYPYGEVHRVGRRWMLRGSKTHQFLASSLDKAFTQAAPMITSDPEQYLTRAEVLS